MAANFITAADLEQRYAVSARALLAYARRGNLAMCRTPDDVLFDEQAVARLFRRRGSGAQQMLGVLGACRVGLRAGQDDV